MFTAVRCLASPLMVRLTALLRGHANSIYRWLSQRCCYLSHRVVDLALVGTERLTRTGILVADYAIEQRLLLFYYTISKQ